MLYVMYVLMNVRTLMTELNALKGALSSSIVSPYGLPLIRL